MSTDREALIGLMEQHYRSHGWPVERGDDGTIRTTGSGGVTWIGLPVVAADIDQEQFERRLLALGDERTEDGRRCPLELLPSPDCDGELRALLRRLRLDQRGHVEVYATAV